jgi:DNA-binding XRE family transcriptional regulator
VWRLRHIVNIMVLEAHVNQTPKPKVKLREVREKLNKNQEEMAQLLGVKRETLNKFENGKRPIEWIEKAINLQKILSEVGYSLEDLIVPSDEEN